MLDRNADDAPVSDYADPMPGPIPPPPPPIEYADVDTRGWWFSMLVGVVLVLVGIWLLTNLFESVTILGIVVGISLVVGGITEALALGSGGTDRSQLMAWVGGGLLVVAGLIVLAWPDITLEALARVAGLALVAAGIIAAIGALTQQHEPGWPLMLGAAGAGIAFGLVVLIWPDATLVVLAVLLGIKAIATGLVAIGAGWQMHRLRG